jgi:hypothetical protein
MRSTLFDERTTFSAERSLTFKSSFRPSSITSSRSTFAHGSLHSLVGVCINPPGVSRGGFAGITRLAN